MAALGYSVLMTPSGRVTVGRAGSALGGGATTLALNLDTTMTKAMFDELLEVLIQIVRKDMQHLSRDFSRLSSLVAPFPTSETFT